MSSDIDTDPEVMIRIPIARPLSQQSAARHVPLIERLASEHGATWVDEASLDAWAQARGDCVLLLAGDTVRYPQGLDVAAVLPELRKCALRPFDVAVAAQADEEAIARRFGANHWPTLLFLREGAYVTAIGGMHDWQPYLEAVNAALQMPPSRIPGVGIPVVSVGGATSCS